MKNKLFLFLVATFLISLASCSKDSFITSPDAQLRISADSIKFDTVFTSTGSVTQQFKIVNENDQKLMIDEIRLAGGTSSAFRLNINGIASPFVTNTELRANDSLYVFVSVLVNPGTANLPFILSDSIIIKYNGNTRYVHLEAYGQNAIFYSNTTLTGNSTWSASKPYVISGSLRVAVNATLTLLPGCLVYVHGNAPFIVDGTMRSMGTAAGPVIFAGDRLDEPYKNFPASWPGIYFRDSSMNNELNFTNVLHAYDAIAVLAPSINASPKLIMNQCQVKNAYNTGIYASHSSIVANNCLVSNCGNNVVLEYGGSYTFTHCTLVAYSNNYVLHKNPVVTASDFSFVNGNTFTSNLSAIFKNSIIWGDNGNVDNELAVSRQGTGTFSVVVDHCLYRNQSNNANIMFTASLQNMDPQFDSIDVTHNYFDFHITKNPLAPGINKGFATPLLVDLDNNNRNVGLPDMGCYEKQ